MYSGEYDACDVTLSVYPHRASLKNIPVHGGNRTHDLWNTSRMLCQLSYAVRSVRVCDITHSNRPDRVAQLAEHWASIPNVVGSIPTVVRHIFQACPVWIYTQSNITSISSSNVNLAFPSTLRKHLFTKPTNLSKNPPH